MDGLLLTNVLFPVGLGLLGFVEPCAIGAHVTFAATLAGRSRATQTASTLLFVAARTLTMGLFGVLAALVGQSFALTQKSFWLAFGLAYVVLGALYVADRISPLMVRIGVGSGAGAGPRNIVMLGVILGLGIPACAAPLLFAASGVAVGLGTAGKAFFAMTLFGLALSAPLLALITFPRTAVLLQWARARGQRIRLFTGWLLVAAGLWGVWFGLFVDPTDWR